MKEEVLPPTPEMQTPEEDVIDIKEILLQAYLHWKLILCCIIIALAGGFIVKKMITPLYSITSAVLVKDDKSSVGGKSGGADMLENLGVISTTSNFDNSVELLTARTSVQKTITELNLYVRYFTKGLFRDQEQYKTVPITVWVSPEDAEKMKFAQININRIESGIDIEIIHKTLSGEEEVVNKHIKTLPSVVPTSFGVFTFTPNNTLSAQTQEEEQPMDSYYVTISAPSVLASDVMSRLSITPRSKTTTIADISFKSAIPERGIDFTKRLVETYNNDANIDKNETASKTAQFINERIEIINKELGTTENEIAAYKKQAGMIDVTANAEVALKDKSDYEKKFADNATQLRLIEFLKTYIKKEENRNEIIPANIGLSDESLNNAVSKYNEMLIEMKRLQRTSSDNNPAVEAMKASIRLMRENVTLAIQTTERGLNIAKEDLKKQASIQAGQLSEAPVQQKELLSIARQQEIKANLYIMLLQKREENNILLASTANNARIVDEPYVSTAPVYPKGMIIYFAALLIGIAVPAAYIYLLNLLHNKINTRADIEKLTKLPVVADIPLNQEMVSKNPIMVQENRNELMEEVYRNLRTNLQYMMEEHQKVIMFTSTTSGEGKSTTAGNLAASFAFMGKRVIVVGMDIRKPGLNRVFKLPRHEEGLTRFLAHPESTDLETLINPTEISPNLFVLTGGVIPPNPTELVNRPSLGTAISILKEKFDIIVLDTAPIGMVTDTQIIAKHADISVYVCRSGVTSKEDFKIVNTFCKEKKLKKTCIVINGIDMKDRKNNYYYGKTKRYGYGYGYGQEQKKL